MRLNKNLLTEIAFFGMIVFLYLIAVFLTFKPRSSGSEYGEIFAFILTLIGGLAIFGAGYASTIILGGKVSLKLIEFISRFNGSKHALEIKEEDDSTHYGIMDYLSFLFIPALVFLIALAVALNIHYLDSTFNVSFQVIPYRTIQDVLSELDIFLKPTSVGSLRYSINIIPIMIFFVAIAGVVPSIVFPYLRKFKVTSYNAVPFHRDILFNTLGSLFGITIILSLIEVIYGVLMGTQPHYYSYVLPAMLGFGLHYSLGLYVGRKKSEELVEMSLKTDSRKRIFRGKIIVQQHICNRDQIEKQK